MECSQKPLFHDLSLSGLYDLKIEKPDEEIKKRVKENWDHIAKPVDGMGRFENIVAQIASIAGDVTAKIDKKAVIVLCADNGIVEEKVSQSGQEVTKIVAKEMTEGKSAVCKMAKKAGADRIIVDIGIADTQQIPGVLQKKIRPGTGNFIKEPAMTKEETLKAIKTGIALVEECKRAGYQILAAGEMGIGNTTTSSAVYTALFQCEAKEVTGRGAGLSDRSLLHKRKIIESAIAKYNLYDADVFTVLQTVGGLDIAGMAGIYIGGALFHIPIVLDGMISMTAALVAERILPGVKEYLIPSHKGKEPAVFLLMQALDMEPILNADMALGEGTGAVMMFSLLDMALCVYQNGTTFSEIQMDPYTRF